MDEHHDEVTIGEVNRNVIRLERAVNDLAGQMQNALGPVGEIKARMNMAEDDIDNLGRKITGVDDRLQDRIRSSDDRFEAKMTTVDERIQDVKVQAARISGGLGLAAFIAAMIPWPWKH